MSQPVRAVQWSPEGGAFLRIIDQRRLPLEYVEVDIETAAEAAEAIRTLAVRGAPAIGVAAAMALVLAAEAAHASRDKVRSAADLLRATRPTAVNLGWALDRMLARADATPGDIHAVADALRDEATRILEEDRAMCRAIGEHGLALIHQGMRVLTHCNAGALATSGIGTALAPVYLAHEQGMALRVYAGETRPLLQGARLTAWELARAGIPVTLVTDGMAASLMADGRVDIVIVGADRIAANGDVANKVGTYGLAVLAHHHRIPFVVAAPWSTVDAATPTGAGIVIEQRDAREVTELAGQRIAPDHGPLAVHNPAFDVTPAALVTHYVTDRGVQHAPFRLDVSSVELPPPA
jgi:methylthioribose-1-phosphate isomerase